MAPFGLFPKTRLNLTAFLLVFACLLFPLLAGTAGPSQGKRYAVLVGISDYADSSILDLKSPRNDVADLAACLQAAGWDKVFAMKDDLDYRNQDFPSRTNIENRIGLLADLAKPEDTIFLFFSGHGVSDGDSGQIFLPVDAALSRLAETGLSLDKLVAVLGSKGIRKVVLASDACRENLSATKGLKNSRFDESRRLAHSPAISFYSTSSGWYSYEEKDGRNSVFTAFLIQGLQGAAAGKSGLPDAPNAPVTFADLAAWLPDALSSWALDQGLRQKPVVLTSNHDLDTQPAGLANSAAARTGQEKPAGPARGQDISMDSRSQAPSSSGPDFRSIPANLTRGVIAINDPMGGDNFFDLLDYFPRKPGTAIRYKIWVDNKLADDFWEVVQDKDAFQQEVNRTEALLYTEYRVRSAGEWGSANEVLMSDEVLMFHGGNILQFRLPRTFNGQDSGTLTWPDGTLEYRTQKILSLTVPGVGTSNDAVSVTAWQKTSWLESTGRYQFAAGLGLWSFEGKTAQRHGGKDYLIQAVETRQLPKRVAKGVIKDPKAASRKAPCMLWINRISVSKSIKVAPDGSFEFPFYGDRLNIYFGEKKPDQAGSPLIDEQTLTRFEIGPDTPTDNLVLTALR